MNFKLPKVNSRSLTKIKIKAIKASPTVLIIGSAVAGIAATVTACRSTIKAVDIYDEYQKEREKIEIVKADADAGCEYASEYTDEAYHNEVRQQNLKLCGNMLKTYSVPILLTLASISMGVGSHMIMSKRVTTLTGTVITLSEALKQYRDNVIEKYGADVDRELANNIKEIEIEDPETGEKKKVKKSIDNKNPYSFWYGPEYINKYGEVCKNIHWTNDSQYNIQQLDVFLRHVNELLKTKESLFINEVLDVFGFPRTDIGATNGWVYEPNDHRSSCYVDFGIDKDAVLKKYRQGITEPILITLNPDGYIVDRI